MNTISCEIIQQKIILDPSPKNIAVSSICGFYTDYFSSLGDYSQTTNHGNLDKWVNNGDSSIVFATTGTYVSNREKKW